MKSPYTHLFFAGLIAATSGVAHAQAWLGTTDQDWTVNTNWDGGVTPTIGGWTVNLAIGNTPIITTAVDNTGADSFVGTGGNTGVLDINAGGSIDSSTKWLFVGGDNGSAGNGTMNVNTGGSYTSDNQIRFGRSGGTGNLNVDGGTVSVSALDEGGGTTTINISNGGTVAATAGNIRMPLGGGSMDSGSISATGQIFIGGGAGNSSFTMSGGSLTSGTWLPIGIGAGSVANLDVSGGSVDVSSANAGSFTTIGANNDAIGTVTMTGGTWTQNGTGGIVLGEGGTASGTFTLTAGDITTPTIKVAPGGTATGILNLDGGTLSTGGVEIGPGTATVNLNGTAITANANSTTFFNGGVTDLLMDTTIDTAGFDVSGNSVFIGSANLTKNGAGSLSLPSDLHDLSGNITVNAGTLILGASEPGTTEFSGAITVADGAGFGVRTEFTDDLILPSDMSFLGTATTLSIDFNDTDFIVPTEPIVIDGGNLNVSGTITVDIAGENMSSGTYVLVDYSSATKVGSVTWALGTLPTGITAPGGIVDDGSTVEVELVAPAPLWEGTQDGNWDTATENWIDQGTSDPLLFASGNVATFDDTALIFNVVTTEDVTPSEAKFINDTEDYTLTAGGGVISGGGGLSKSMLGGLTITGMANTYTGVTTLAGGTVTVDTLTNGGVASPLGAATSDPANLDFAGGTLHYTGAATSTDRGFVVSGAGSQLINDNELTLTGAPGGGAGSLASSGAGNVNFTNLTASSFGTGYPGLAINEATWTFDGSAGTLGDQTVTVPGELWLASTPNVSGNLVIKNSVLNVAGYLAMSRGNGDTGTVSTLTVDGSNVTSGNFSSGFIGGEATNDVVSNIDLLNGATFNMGDRQNFSENANAVTTLTVDDTSVLTGNTFIIGLGENSQADVILNDSAGLVLGNGWTAVGAGYNGANGNGSLTLNDNSTLTDSGEAFNIGDVDGGHGTVNINDSATVTLNGGGTVFVGKGNSDASDATGVINISGGSFTTEGIITLGTRIGATGEVNVTGGVFTQLDVADRFIVGDEGTGTLTVSGTGSVVSNGVDLTIGDDPTSTGTVNLETGGVLTARKVQTLAGLGTLNFNGGTLKPLVGAADFLNAANVVVLAGGGTIDSDGFNITALSSISGEGDLTKAGGGTLTLSGTNTHSGTLVIATGTVTTTATTTLHGSSGVDIKSGAILNLNFAGDQFVEAFFIDGVLQPDGTYNTGNTVGITGAGNLVVQPFVTSPYATWIDTFYPGETDPLIVGEDADPDMDGQSNKVEFALGGTPDSGADNAKVYSFTTDRLLMTIAVLDATPAFGAGPAPSATIDDCTYTITGSDNLTLFNSAVSEAPLETTGLPPAPAGYKYQTFSLDSSIGLPDLGFMRVEITP